VNILVIHAHPVATSFAAACRDRAIDRLRGGGHAVGLLDLYEEAFDPRLSRQERLDYHDPARNRAAVAAYLERLEWAEAVLFVFPVWSFGVPAILKGFFDRCLLPGFAWDFTPTGSTVPKLQHIRAVAAIATYGKPRWTVWRSVGDLPRREIVRYFAGYCAPRLRPRFLALYDMNGANTARRARFLQRIDRELARWP
jgi:NAD(P)H dehydrogenase (quinone)